MQRTCVNLEPFVTIELFDVEVVPIILSEHEILIISECISLGVYSFVVFSELMDPTWAVSVKFREDWVIDGTGMRKVSLRVIALWGRKEVYFEFPNAVNPFHNLSDLVGILVAIELIQQNDQSLEMVMTVTVQLCHYAWVMGD